MNREKTKELLVRWENRFFHNDKVSIWKVIKAKQDFAHFHGHHELRVLMVEVLTEVLEYRQKGGHYEPDSYLSPVPRDHHSRQPRRRETSSVRSVPSRRTTTW